MKARRARKTRRRGVLIKTGFFIYIALGLFAMVWLRTAIVSLEYKLGDLEKQRASLISEREMVVAQRASLYSMGNVESVALRRLGMEHPVRDNIYYVKRTGVAGPRRASARK